ncbi:MAG: hypothetical protein IPK77_09310 [Cellvibrio sp.]|nr:hypothetical protein [Cellvibrio sp.]
MNKLFVVLLSIFISVFAVADDWVSPIDKKYSQKNVQLFQIFNEARALLDGWQGQRVLLVNANALLLEVLNKDPNFAPAHREYGRLFIMSGLINSNNIVKENLDVAETSILKSIEIEPAYADSFVLLGHLYTVTKKYSDAEVALKKAEEIGTETPWLDLNWADLLVHQAKYLAAITRYEKVIQSNTANRKAYLSALSGITDVYYNIGDYNKVNDSYKKQIAYDPKSAWVRGNYAGFLLFTFNDVDGAIKNAEQALEIMNYGLGRFTLACALYTKWAQLKSDPVTSTQAQVFFEKAWAIYPNPQAVIDGTRSYPYTKVTAIALENWLLENPEYGGSPKK